MGFLKDVAEQQNVENCKTRLARSASCEAALDLDYDPGILGTMLKRSMSAPSLAEGSSFCHGSQHHQRTFSFVATTATVHDAIGSQCQVGKIRPNLENLTLQSCSQKNEGLVKKRLKRSMSTPSLAKVNSSSQYSQLFTTTTAIHTGCGQLKQTEI